jgi:hypothetical protein
VEEVWCSQALGCRGASKGCDYDYELSTTAPYFEQMGFIVLHGYSELRIRSGTKEEQIRM